MISNAIIRRRRWLGVLSALALLAGCAGNATYNEGMALLQQGNYEEAVAKLGEASRQAPGDPQLRKDYLRAREEVGNRYVAGGNAERAAERYDRAEEAYKQAVRIDPSNARAKAGLEAVAMDRRHARIVAQARELFNSGDAEGAAARLKEVFLENANMGSALQLQQQINERAAKELVQTPGLRKNFQKPVTLQFRDANLKMVLESISKTSGINILTDKDVRADLKATIFVTGTSVEDTIDLILMQNQLEKKVLSDNTIFIYPNTPAKLKDYQDLKVRSFHLVNADVKQMQAMIKTILKTRDLFINEKTNSLVMRDTPEAIRLAEKIIADQDTAEPEVMLEVEVLEITRTLLSELGIRYPDQLTLTPSLIDPLTGASLPPTLGNLGQRTRENLLVSPVPSITLNAHLDNSDVNLLASPRIRARNREKAKIHIGDRVPVLTNSVTPVASGSPVVTGSVQYIEVGLKLEVEPDIHTDGEVGIKVSLEVSNIVNQVTNAVSGTVAYQIGTRNASTVLRLKDGETQVLAGLIDDEDRRAANLVPGLGELPLLGRLFSTHHNDKKKSEIVLSITPRLVSKTKLQDAQSMEFWTGTESTLRSTPIGLRQYGAVSTESGGAAAPARTTALPLAPRPGLLPAPTGAPRAPAAAPPAPQAPAAAPPAPAAAQPISFNLQGPAQAKVGDRFTLTLGAHATDPVRGFDFLLGYDPAALKAVEVLEGTFLKQQNVPSKFHGDINQPSGQVTLELVGSGEQGAKGSGSVAAITFEVTAASARSEISVIRVAPAGLTGELLSHTPPSSHSLTLNP
jgi:general secretion pathway protein D